MLFVGIDLAERHSAAVVVDEDGKPVFETVLDSGPKETPPNPFSRIRKLAPWWEALIEIVDTASIAEVANGRYGEVVWAVEDIPPHLMDPNGVLKLQGSLLAFMTLYGIEAHLVKPKQWQGDFGYVSKKATGDTKKWATALCEERGYTPGELINGKVLAKPKTDLRDAYLIAIWLRDLCVG